MENWPSSAVHFVQGCEDLCLFDKIGLLAHLTLLSYRHLMIPDLLHALRFHICLERNLLFLLSLSIICQLYFLANLLISLSLSLDEHLNSLFVDVLLKLELLILL